MTKQTLILIETKCVICGKNILGGLREKEPFCNTHTKKEIDDYMKQKARVEGVPNSPSPSQDDIKLKDEILEEYLGSDMSADALILRTISKTRSACIKEAGFKDADEEIAKLQEKHEQELFDARRWARQEGHGDGYNLVLKEVFDGVKKIFNKHTCYSMDGEEARIKLRNEVLQYIKKHFGVK
jgi:hypothetical protein